MAHRKNFDSAVELDSGWDEGSKLNSDSDSPNIPEAQSSQSKKRYKPLDSSYFIEITNEEMKNAPHMKLLLETGRHSTDPTAGMGIEGLNQDIGRSRVVINNLSDEEIKMIATRHQQDIFSTSDNLIRGANPQMAVSSNAKAFIYKENDTIYAENLSQELSLSLAPLSPFSPIKTALDDLDPVYIPIPGEILLRYEWKNGNWKRIFLGANTPELKSLLLGQHEELDEIRKLNEDSEKVDAKLDEAKEEEKKLRRNLPNANSEKAMKVGSNITTLRKASEAAANTVKSKGGSVQSLIDSITCSIPVSGKIGHYVENCFISLRQLQNSLRKYTGDPNLKINKEENEIGNQNITVFNVSTHAKSIPLFENLGITRQRGSNNQSHYKLQLDDSAKIPSEDEPLFSLRLRVKDQTRSLDVSSLFATEQINKFKKEAFAVNDAKKERDNVLDKSDENLLDAMREVNRYLKKRAQRTALGFFDKVLNNYSGGDYYDRRNSWEKILKKMKQSIQDDPTCDINQLKEFIRTEADNFKFCFQRSRYHKVLMKLHNAINNSADLKKVANFVDVYAQIYHQMGVYTSVATKHYSKNSSFFKMFSSKKGKYAEVLREGALYKTQYELLSQKDQDDFLNEKQQKKAEQKNIRRR